MSVSRPQRARRSTMEGGDEHAGVKGAHLFELSLANAPAASDATTDAHARVLASRNVIRLSQV